MSAPIPNVDVTLSVDGAKATSGNIARFQAAAAIAAIRLAGERLAKAVCLVQLLEDERPLIKARCIEAMIGTPNPLGKNGAVHSATSAEAIVEQHQGYWLHRQKQNDAEVERHRALAMFEAAKRTADLEVIAYGAQAGES